MLKHILSLLLGLTTISQAQELICAPNEVCTVAGNSTVKIIADKNVTALIITCIDKDVCKKKNQDSGLIVYSSAIKTFVFCEGENSCEEIELNFGITPAGGLATDFEVVRDEVGVSCLGKQSCKNMIINNNGLITNGLNVKSSAEKDASLMSTIIECGTVTQCTIECQKKTLLPSVCKDTKCYGNCVCLPNGAISGCPTDLNIRPTVQPTKSPVKTVVVVPTPKPTPSPVDPRNSTSCDVGTCVIEPLDNYDVNCESTASICTIACITENQCANGVIIQANSRKVELICEGVNSCDKVKIFGIESNEINIILKTRKSGENMMIAIDNPKSNLTIIAEGDESFTNGQLFCDGNCLLKCLGKFSCKTTLYECLNSNDKCLCNNGLLGNQKCPKISLFGDDSCNNKKLCNIIGNGNQRIIALNNVDELIIDCSQFENQCKSNGNGLKIFSSAKKTKLLCNNINSCEEVSIFVGDLKYNFIPKGFNSNEFIVHLNEGTINQPKQKQTLDINCNAESACNKLNLYTTKHVNTNILANAESALDRALLKCDNCESLNFECRDFDGCIGTSVLCPSVNIGEINRCKCNPIFVNVTGLTTLAPRATCPIISVYGNTQKQSGIAAVMNTGNGNNVFNQNIKIVIALSLSAMVFLLIGGFILSKYKKSYEKINDPQNNEKMLVNENIYATQFQVEMQ